MVTTRVVTRDDIFIVNHNNPISHSLSVTTDLLPPKLVLKNLQADKYKGNIH